MPCKIQIKQNITSKIEASTNAALGKSLDVAQSIAKEVNDEYKAPVVRFVQRGTDLIDRIISVPQSLVDEYYNSELLLEEEDARRVQMEDARRAGEDYTDRYLYFQTSPDQVNYNLRALDILQSEKAKQVFAKGSKNNWSLDKILTELQVPKEQKQIILAKDIDSREEIITSLLADNSFTIEINTAINKTKQFGSFEAEPGIPMEAVMQSRTATASEKGKPTSYYANLTVPGGTNYTENEIATPAITPSIKGHAQFSTDKGIGWFRSDEQVMGGEFITEDFGAYDEVAGSYQEDIRKSTKGGTPTKTRRILEVQSDLFQKGRDKKDLVKQGNVTSIGKGDWFNYEGTEYDISPFGKYKKYIGGGNWKEITEQEYNTAKENSKKESKGNQFLQLLNKNNNWVTFFVKSIIQDSAKKGYEKVLFPSGNTATKIEGHQTLEEFIKDREKRMSKLKEHLAEIQNVSKIGDTFYGTLRNGKKILETIDDEWDLKEVLSLKDDLNNQIKQFELENERVRREGFGALKPIYNFYENTVTNILKKNGYNPVEITDEYGNKWNQIEITPTQATQSILLQRKEIAGVPIIDTEDIVSYEGTKGAASYSREANVIKVNRRLLKQKFTEKAWTKPRKLMETLHGEIIESYAEALPADQFKTYDEWEQFVIAHEYQHSLYSREDFNAQFPNGTKGQYETEINKRALRTQPTAKASSEVITKVKEVIKKMGVDVKSLSEYAKQNPAVDVSSVNALADLTAGIIAVSEGKEDVALTEEMVHIATAIIEQRDPKLITELISKVGRFKVYKDTLEAYKDLPAYQQPDGKPNIRKIKKEAVDKLIADIIINGDFTGELAQEENRSLIRRMWDAITDWFRGQYKKANIDIFSTTAKTVLGGEFEGSVLDLNSEELYYQLSDTQKDLQRRLAETEQVLGKVVKPEELDPNLMDEEKSTNYYTILRDGVVTKVANRVTDRVKAWYKRKFRNQKFTEQEKKDNKAKANFGTKYHGFFEDIHARFFNSDGTRRSIAAPRRTDLNRVDSQIYSRLEKYYTDLITSFSENGKNPLVFSEVKIYDPTQDEAGTIDLLIVEEDGTAHIYDWKFMSVAKGAEDIAWYKQGAYNEQLRRYKEIIMSQYGVTKIGRNRAIPILMSLKRENFQDPKSNLEISGIEIGTVNPKNIEPLVLTPISEVSESTGYKAFDDLLKKLRAIYVQEGSRMLKDEDERKYKIERLNILSKAMRSLRAGQNFGPLVDAIESFREEGENIIATYNTTYKGKPATSKDLNDLELSNFSDRISTYIDFSGVFGTLFDSVSQLLYTEGSEEFALDEADRKRILNAKEGVNALRISTERIRINGEQIVELGTEFQDKFVGERNLVAGLSRPEAIITSFTQKWFTGLSSMGLEATKVLSKLANRAQAFANREALGEVNRLLEIRDKLEARGGSLKDLALKVYQKDKEGSIVNKLIQRYQQEFFDQARDNARLASESTTTRQLNIARQWLLDNIDIDAYKKEAALKMEKELARVMQNTLSRDDEYRVEQLLKVKRTWDISRTDFNGFDNPLIKKFPLPKWESQEYIELKKDPELFELYNFILEMNTKAREMGYISNQVASTFLPFVRKGIAESLAWDYSLKPIVQFKNTIKKLADDVGYGKINEVTGEVELGIPKYYTTDFSAENADGVNDYSEVSLELFKNLILYINHMNRYKYMSEIEGQVLLMRKLQTFKSNYVTGKYAMLQKEDGRFREKKNEKGNLEILDRFIASAIYGQKYPVDKSDFIIPSVISGMKNVVNVVSRSVSGKNIFKDTDKPSMVSLTRTIDALNRYIQLKSLGFEPISGAKNSFGIAIQFSALSGKYFKTRELGKYVARFSGGLFGADLSSKDEQEMVTQLIDTFMPLKDDPTYDKLQEAGLTKLTQINSGDSFFVFFRKPEQVAEKALFMAILDNTMVEDGKLVNITDYVRNKYRTEDIAEYVKAEPKIKQEIEELKKTRSINATRKLEDGKLVIPGLDLKNLDELQRLTQVVRRISRAATGGTTDFDNIGANMSVWFRSLMVFKGWIPKLAETRFAKFNPIIDDLSVEVDESGTIRESYDVGRIRLWFDAWGAAVNSKTSNILDLLLAQTNIMKGNEKGIELIDKLFDKYTKSYYDRTGKVPTITKAEFSDLIRQNLYNEAKELRMLLGVMAFAISVGFMAPDDDEDRATKNAFRYFQRTLDGFISELSFFYSPSEMSDVLDKGTVPAISLFTDLKRFITHSRLEITGFDYSNPQKTTEQVKKSAQPIKYLMKLFPGTKSLVTWLAALDDDFAREFDVTLPKTNR